MEYEKSQEKHGEIVVLILEGTRIEVEKQKLINKSRYFAALLSGNYVEFHQLEHTINYDIPLVSWEDFIDWIESDKLYLFVPIFDENKLERLLVLLEIGVLFAVDELIEDITEMIERYYLLLKHVIDIWLFAQELSLNVLRDLCLATCVDRFTELPFSIITNLPKENFLELVTNSNIKCSESYLLCIIRAWEKYHKEIIPLSILKNKQPKILQGIISSENCNDINAKLYIHYWDGKSFYEFATLNYPEHIIESCIDKNVIAGMQAAARGYNLYFCGGEFGIGTGKYNDTVWRYSLISKRWFFQTSMPSPRRHMIATFLDNKLLLIGGVGQFRQKLTSTDIYNVHTDTWTQGARIPMDFIEVPKYFVYDKKVIVYNHVFYIHMYNLDSDVWKTVKTKPLIKDISMKHMMPIMSFETASCFIEVKSNKMILRSITQTRDTKCCNRKASDGACMEVNLTDYLWYLVECKYHMKIYFITSEKTGNHLLNQVLPICMKSENKPNKFYLHSIPIQHPEKFRSRSLSPLSTINLSNPVDLHVKWMTLNTTDISLSNIEHDV